MTTETFTFSSLRRVLTKNFEKLASGKLYYVTIDRDEIWEQYIGGFDESERQEHNCNACKSFLRQFGGIVAITEENKVVSIWDDLDVSSEYRSAIANVRNYVLSRPITDVFLSEVKKCGVNKNLDRVRNVTWEHFYIELPTKFVSSGSALSTNLGQARDDRNVMKRSLDELTVEATETVLELIGQNSLYRGKEFEPLLSKFVLLQRRYARIPADQKEAFCWATASESGAALCRIRNTAIGTLLIDLSEGLDLESAVSKFERVVAPTNYKRPTSLVTPKMVEQAKEKLAELGLVASLERRYANEADIRACDILFKDRPSPISDVFYDVAKDAIVNPRSFSKVEEISIEDFIANVVPHAKSISVLLENSHMHNFVSLITSKDPEAPSLFKWGNGFSWSYTGAIADSIKERVKQAGGKVDGILRTSLSWGNYDDLDIHVNEPNGNHIFYGNKRSAFTGAMLDVDMNAGCGTTRTPVENIIWTDESRMKEGNYVVSVNNFCKRETQGQGYEVQIECNGEVFDFQAATNPRDRETQIVAQFTYSKTKGITFKGEAKSNVISKEKWGLKTNQFHTVTKLLLSPNRWENPIGNKHFLFMLENCIADETPRPFFNEFLKEELDAHRKVFEILGSKVKIEDTTNQLSGLGFSETKRASLIAKVTGAFTRTLKINF